MKTSKPGHHVFITPTSGISFISKAVWTCLEQGHERSTFIQLLELAVLAYRGVLIKEELASHGAFLMHN